MKSEEINRVGVYFGLIIFVGFIKDNLISIVKVLFIISSKLVIVMYSSSNRWCF
jgi:hypothetical protein